MEKIIIPDSMFRQAVEAIDSGNTTELGSLLQQHPQLVRQRLDVPKEGYFKHPYLLWFIADNPIRHEKLPANIVAITRQLIDTLKREAPEIFQDQIEYTLDLVATGCIPRECGVQIDLIDLLMDAGANPASALGAIANSNPDAAKHLIRRGAPLTLPVAVGLGWSSDVDRLTQTASDAEKQVALVVAAYFAKAGIVAFLIGQGVDVNGHPRDFYGFHSHGTALHQAVHSGSLQSVQMLVEAGARLDTRDRAHNATPLGWAIYMQTVETSDASAKQNFATIEAFLREKGSHP